MSRKGKNLDTLDGLDNFNPKDQDKEKLFQLTQLAMYVENMQATINLDSFIANSNDPDTVNKLDCFGRAPLHWIVGQNYFPGCESLLLEYNADVNVRTNKEGLTPLMVACRKGGSAKIAQLLLKNHADHSLRAKSSATAFHIAVASGNRNCMRILILHGADPYLLMKSGKSALDLAKDDQMKTLVYSCLRSALIHKEKKEEVCAQCDAKEFDLQRCGNCYSSFYCSRHCQQEHWKSDHHQYCPGNIVASVINDSSKNEMHSFRNNKAFVVRLFVTSDSDTIAESEEKGVYAKVKEQTKRKFSSNSTPTYHWARFTDNSRAELLVYFSKCLQLFKQ